tara:strand:+ start:913 stop:1572 length:660 start_codon:yes stop_codon:yes gene_type:complete
MTAKIKLNAASGGGSVSIQAPSSSSNNRVISLPDIADGTLVTSQSTLDATKLSGALPAISGANLTGISAGLNASYAKLTDTKGSTTQGGSFTNGDWRTRDINTEDTDPDGIVSISSNQFTLQAGTYYIHAQCCAVGVNNHSARIYNTTDSSTTLTGLSNKTQEENVSSYAQVMGQFTISGAKVFELQHRCQDTVTTHGFGAYSSWNANVYSIIEIYKRN